MIRLNYYGNAMPASKWAFPQLMMLWTMYKTMAKAMAKMKSNFKTMGENPDCGIASLITDGCNMGIKSLYRYLNQYPAADDKVKHLTQEIIDTEEKLQQSMRPYL